MIGDIELKKLKLDDSIYNELSKRYIAIDVETTGLNPVENYITEIGLVLFENGKIVKEYNSLIKVKELIPDEIIELTGITNEMVFNAPKEEVVYKEVVEFLGDVLDEKTIMVAHNAIFDMGFLANSLKRYGYLGVIRYVDTLNISRSLVRGLFNYKQDTVATYFNIVNERSHRALTDAKVCGRILFNLLQVYNTKSQTVDINTKFDDQFELKVKERGIIYYRFNMVNNYEEINNGCKCVITGAERYDVSLNIEDNKLIGNCNCQFFKDKGNCKHIYALLLKYLGGK